jgi:predicted kinase
MEQVKVIMMCGVCGSGKTTYAKEKEKEGYIRLSIDEEMWKCYGTKGVDYPDNRYEELSEKIELLLREKLLKLIREGKNVVIDFSFWNKKSRSFYRKLIEKAGGTVEIVYMKASFNVLKMRLSKRNLHIDANSPFIITDEILKHHYYGFQEPCGEGEIIILQNNDSI